MLILLVWDPTLRTINLDEHVPFWLLGFPTMWGGAPLQVRQNRVLQSTGPRAESKAVLTRTKSVFLPASFCPLPQPPPRFWYSFGHAYSHGASRTSNPLTEGPRRWLLCATPLQTTFPTCLDLLWGHASQKEPRGGVRPGECTRHHPL